MTCQVFRKIYYSDTATKKQYPNGRVPIGFHWNIIKGKHFIDKQATINNKYYIQEEPCSAGDEILVLENPLGNGAGKSGFSNVIEVFMIKKTCYQEYDERQQQDTQYPIIWIFFLLRPLNGLFGIGRCVFRGGGFRFRDKDLRYIIGLGRLRA